MTMRKDKDRVMGKGLTVLLGLGLAVFFMAPKAWADGAFTDVTASSGIEFKHTFGDDKLSNIVETMGSGAAFFDYDNDGDMDLYVVTGSYNEVVNGPLEPGKTKMEATNRLYRNNGDGTFTDVTEKAGVGHSGYGMGCAVGDYDNDGFDDLYVTNYGPNVLYKNLGDGTFKDVTKEAGVGDEHWGVSATFFDYDGDGDLDLYVGNYLEYDPDYKVYYSPEGFPGPLSYSGQPDVLYKNNGDGTFKDATREAGLYNPLGKAMGVATADYDNDGDLDLFVANDAMENFLYQNNGDGTFTEVGLEKGVAYGEGGEQTSAMGVSFGDYNNDGHLDLFVPDMTFGALYANNGDGTFRDMTIQSGIAQLCGQYIGWTGHFFDYDNDGDLDLLMVNGEVHHSVGQEDLLLENDGKGTFQDALEKAGDHFTKEFMGRGAAFADYDNDGDLDVFIVNSNDRAVLLRNDMGNKNNFLIIKALGAKSNKNAIGTRIKVVTDSKAQIAEVRSGSDYLSQSDMRVHLGLVRSDKVDLLEVRWPSGKTQTFKNVKANQFLMLEEGKKLKQR